jgi:hypothetical protein
LPVFLSHAAHAPTTPTDCSTPSSVYKPGSNEPMPSVSLTCTRQPATTQSAVRVLDLAHDALVGFVGAVKRLGDEAVQPAPSNCSNHCPARARSVVVGVRWIGGCAVARSRRAAHGTQRTAAAYSSPRLGRGCRRRQNWPTSLGRADFPDAGWPPVYPKMPGEPLRVAPRRARKVPRTD